MKVEFLKELGLADDVIAKIQAENGKDVQKEKDKLSGIELERDNYKTQLETAQTALKDFDGVDVKELQGKITTLQTDLAQKETDYQNKISDMEFNSALNTAIKTFGARNEKAVIPFLDLKALKASKNQAEDIKTALTQVKTDNDYLFSSDEPFKNPVGPTGAPPTGGNALSSLRSAMGLPEEKK